MCAVPKAVLGNYETQCSFLYIIQIEQSITEMLSLYSTIDGT